MERGKGSGEKGGIGSRNLLGRTVLVLVCS